MKRKKQLLSWILSFLMVFSIMPMVSISALAATYDMNNIHVGSKLYPGDVIQDTNNNGIKINYFKDQTDAHNGVSSKVMPTEAGKDAKILSLDEAPSGYVLDGYIVEAIIGSADTTRSYNLIAEWKEVNKITYDITNITANVVGEKYDIGGQTYVTSGSAVTITIAANTGYKLPDTIIVKMGETALDSSDYEYDKTTGIITVSNITGDVKIKAGGVQQETPPPTPPADPQVTTPPAISVGEVTSVGKTSATLKSSITKGNELIINQGFEWKETDGVTYAQISGTLNNGILTATLIGLTKNTSYTIRPFVVTETDTYYGTENTFKTKKNTSSGSSASSGSSGSDSKSDILIVEPTEEAIIKALKTSDYKKIQTNIDSNPNLLLSKAIIDALTENKDKTLIIVSNNVSTNMTINENNEMQFTRNGSLLAGFVPVCNAEYYSNYNGIAQKGWVQFPGETWYYLDKETGIKGKGWINDNGTWYYLNSSGIMQRGWLNDSGTWYYLSKSGAMLANTIIDGYVLGASGAWLG